MPRHLRRHRLFAALAVVAGLGGASAALVAHGQEAAPAAPPAAPAPAAAPMPSELLVAIDAERRDLEQRQAQLAEREALLAVAEARIRHEVDRLALIKREIEGQLAQQSTLLEADLKRMGALRRYMKWTTVTFTIGFLAIAGIPPLSGFWAKGDVLDNTFAHFKPLWVLGLLTAVLTAYYMSRLETLAFGGKDLRTAYLGCLKGTSLASFRSPVAGIPHVHRNWN